MKTEFLKYRTKNIFGIWTIKYSFEVAEDDGAKVENALAKIGLTFREPER